MVVAAYDSLRPRMDTVVVVRGRRVNILAPAPGGGHEDPAPPGGPPRTGPPAQEDHNGEPGEAERSTAGAGSQPPKLP